MADGLTYSVDYQEAYSDRSIIANPCNEVLLGGVIDGDTLSINIETNPFEGHILTWDGTSMVWTGTGTCGPKTLSMIENFIEHFDICGPGGAVIEDILKKKNSERTKKEKEIIRNLMKEDKAPTPKLNLDDPPQVADGVVFYDDATGQLMFGTPNGPQQL